jgi:hypothetical protein
VSSRQVVPYVPYGLYRRIKPGETLEATDVYKSSNGHYELCPCPGLVLQDGVLTEWYRPNDVSPSTEKGSIRNED